MISKIEISKTCEYVKCKREFLSHKENTKFCNKACRYRQLNIRVCEKRIAKRLAARAIRLANKRCAYEPCGVSFIRKGAATKYCSKQCANASRKIIRRNNRKRAVIQLKSRVCDICLKEFIPENKRGLRNSKRCSNLCRSKAKTINDATNAKKRRALTPRKRRPAPTLKVMLPSKACAYAKCAKAFTPYRKAAKFCSRICYRSFYYRDPAVGVEQKCVQCPTIFISKRLNHIHCSMPCFYKTDNEKRRIERSKKLEVASPRTKHIKCEGANCGKESNIKVSKNKEIVDRPENWTVELIGKNSYFVLCDICSLGENMVPFKETNTSNIEERSCVHCNRKFEVDININRKQTTCSRSCRYARTINNIKKYNKSKKAELNRRLNSPLVLPPADIIPTSGKDF